MKSFVKKMEERGFSLIELMVVVAIIGVLAAIAIPNFRTYQARSRTSEAKLALSNVWVTQESFSQENGSYSSCLSDMGVEAPAANRFYAFGFDTTGAITSGETLAVAGVFGAGNCTAFGNDEAYFKATKGIGGAAVVDPSTGSADPGITATTYTAAAAGRIGNATPDTWTINQVKTLSHTDVSY